MIQLLLALLLASPAIAQDAGEPPFRLPLFTDGLQTRFSPNVIPDGALSQALNVVLDQDVSGVVVNRNGYAKFNTTALPNAQSVRGLWSFDATDGTHYMIANTSATFYSSTGDGNWTAIAGLTGFSLTKDFRCTQTIGYLWCANGDTVFQTNVASTATVSAAPLGDKIDRFRNRVLIAGASGQKGRLLMSGELGGTDWTLGNTSTSPANIAVGGVDDGLGITCLMGTFQDVYMIGKLDSLWGLYGFGRNDFQLRELSREVGCLEQGSVKEKNNCLYWLSRRGYEKYCGTQIERVSDPIRDQIDIIIASAGNAKSAIDTTESDFEAGNLTASGPGAPVSSTISPGNIVVSSWTVTDSTASWAAGTLTNTSISSSAVATSLVQLTPRTTNTALGNPTWTFQSGTNLFTNTSNSVIYSVNQSKVNNQSYSGIQSASTETVAFGVWSATMSVMNSGSPADTSAVEWAFVSSSSTFTNVNGYELFYTGNSGISGQASLQLRRLDNGIPTILAQTSGILPTSVAIDNTFNCSFSVQRTLTGLFTVTGVDISSTTPGSCVTSLSAVDTTYVTNSSYTALALQVTAEASPNALNIAAKIINLSVPDGYPASGTFTSQAYNTGFSTPTGGPFRITVSSDASAAVTFQVKDSANGSVFGNATTTLPNARVTNQRQYLDYVGTFTNTIATRTATFNNVTLTAATTGYFISQCRNPGANITAWSNFTCNTVPNGGSFSFYISTGSSCNQVTRTTATWNSQGNNSVISVATSSYVAYRALFSVDVGTESPTLQDCTLNWVEGATRPPLATAVYLDRLYVAFTTSTLTGSANDHELVLDRNDKWTLFDDHNCYSLALYNRKLYCGSSSANGYVYQQDVGTDDDGAAFTSRIRTKAFNFDMPERRKAFRNLYLDVSPAPDISSVINLTARYVLERSTNTYTLGVGNLNEDPGTIQTFKYAFPLTDPPSNPVSGRYIQLEFESSGTNQPWRLFGGRLMFSALSPE